MNTLDILMDSAKRFIDVLIVVNIFPRGREILLSDFYEIFFSTPICLFIKLEKLLVQTKLSRQNSWLGISLQTREQIKLMESCYVGTAWVGGLFVGFWRQKYLS